MCVKGSSHGEVCVAVPKCAENNGGKTLKFYGACSTVENICTVAVNIKFPD